MQPGISLGVVLDGQLIYEHHLGYRNINTKITPNSNTLYCIGSLTKALITASLGILVAERKLSWDDPISCILPDVEMNVHSAKMDDVTLRDILSHRTGLDGLEIMVQGLHSQLTLEHRDLLDLIRILPARAPLRSTFIYCNAMYGVAGKILERLAPSSCWATFVRERILKPLEMYRTTALVSNNIQDANLATPYTTLSDGTFLEEPHPSLSQNSLNGAAGGIYSCVADLSKWCIALLECFGGQNSQSWESRNPIVDLSEIMTPACLVDPQQPENGEYCLGWLRQTTPTVLGLGSQLSPTGCALPQIGTESPPLAIYSHSGKVPGYSSALYLVPDASFAIIVLSNGTGLGDAADLIAQDVIQGVFRLQPSINFVEEAKRRVPKYLSWFDNSLYRPWLEAREIDGSAPPAQDFLGVYKLDRIDFKLAIRPSIENDGLTLMVNSHTNQIHHLQHYQHDEWTFMPRNFNEYLTKGYGQFDLVEEFILYFRRAPDHHICGLTWHTNGLGMEFTKIAQ
jgi:CubicO group peptidase (beta-lactamase class C family)